MAPLAGTYNTQPITPGVIPQYIKLENRLVLLAWINSLLGYKRNKDLLADAKGAAEGFDDSGRSFLYHHLIGRGSQVKIPAWELERYADPAVRVVVDMSVAELLPFHCLPRKPSGPHIMRYSRSGLPPECQTAPGRPKQRPFPPCPL